MTKAQLEQAREANRIQKRTKRAEAKQKRLAVPPGPSPLPPPPPASDQKSLPIVQVLRSCQRCKDLDRVNLEKLQEKNEKIEGLEKELAAEEEKVLK